MKKTYKIPAIELLQFLLITYLVTLTLYCVTEFTMFSLLNILFLLEYLLLILDFIIRNLQMKPVITFLRR